MQFRRWSRSALVTGVALAFVIALPSAAMAVTKSATRLTGLRPQFDVNASNPLVPAGVPVATVKLQRKSGTAWINMAGSVKVYRRVSGQEGWTYLATKWAAAGTSISFKLSQRGEYRVSYAGSTSYLPSAALSSRYDKIISSFTDPTFTFTDLGGGKTEVKAVQSIEYNNVAYPGLIGYYSIDAYLMDPADELNETELSAYRSVRRPGQLAQTWILDAADAFTMPEARSYIWFDDEFVLEAETEVADVVGGP